MYLNETNSTDFYDDTSNTTEINYYYGEPTLFDVYPFSSYVIGFLIIFYFIALFILKIVANTEANNFQANGQVKKKLLTLQSENDSINVAKKKNIDLAIAAGIMDPPSANPESFDEK